MRELVELHSPAHTTRTGTRTPPCIRIYTQLTRSLHVHLAASSLVHTSSSLLLYSCVRAVAVCGAAAVKRLRSPPLTPAHIHIASLVTQCLDDGECDVWVRVFRLLHRAQSTSRHAAPRLPNLVVPYPASLLGPDPHKGRPAPWASTTILHKPVLAFAAFGMLTNHSWRSAAELRTSFATHCSAPERRMIAASSCYGKRCRFALRAVIMQELEDARVPLRERLRRERSCLREARACPEVMSLTFWAPHDGGEGAGKLSDHKLSPREPLYVDDREANDVLAVYRVMLSSTFCIHIGGDVSAPRWHDMPLAMRTPESAFESAVTHRC